MNIVISGTVGVGKSTISNKLEKRLQNIKEDVFLIKELEEYNPYLEKYYENRPEWSFLIQMDFMMNRFNKAYKNSSKKIINIFDRHFLDDFIIASMPFVKNDMSMMNWQAYNMTNIELAKRLKDIAKVDYFFLLKADFDKIIERIAGRGRKEEQDVDVEYWKNMYNQYYENQFIQDYIITNVEKLIVIDTNKKDVDSIVDDILKVILN